MCSVMYSILTESPSEIPSESPSKIPSESPTCGAVSVAIPVFLLGAIANQQVTTLPPNAIITAVRVTLDMTHTWISDMIINLKAPNGKVLNSFNQHGGNEDNLVNTIVSSASTTPFSSGSPPFTGTFRATATQIVGPTGYVSNVASFNELYSVPNGVWTLAMQDIFSPDIGFSTKWIISIDYTIPPNPSSTTAEFRYCDG